MKDKDLTGGQWRFASSKKFSCQSDLYFNLFRSFFSQKIDTKPKRKPSNVKYIHIKKYRLLKAKANHFENAIDFVSERFLCK